MKRSKAKPKESGSKQNNTKSKRPLKPRREDEKSLDKVWSEAVRTRDKRCMRCGSESSLQAHHVFGRRNKATRWILDNGITLCYPCHIHWAHRDVGAFCSFWQEKYGMSKWDVLNRLSKSTYKPDRDALTHILMSLNNSILINSGGNL